MTIVDKIGDPYLVCEKDEYEVYRKEPIILATFRGNGRHTFPTSIVGGLEQRLENLTWERTMAISDDKKCPKCKSYAVYMINPFSKLYMYGCPKCHTIIH